MQLRRLLLVEDGTYRMDPDEKELFLYYANAISHWLEPPPDPDIPFRRGGRLREGH